MREAGRITAEALCRIREMIKPGIPTIELDREAERYIKKQGAELAFKGYRGFPANICVSLNEEVVHGIPGDRKIKEGDIVSIDIGVRHKNYYADAAITVSVGAISDTARRLMETTRAALETAIQGIKPGGVLSKLSATIQDFVEGRNFSVVRKYVGHGIGLEMHEDPQVPNYRILPDEQMEVVLKPGLVLAIEPMVNEGTHEVETLSNGWTVVTRDRKLSAHFEHTVAVTEDGYEILTKLPQ